MTGLPSWQPAEQQPGFPLPALAAALGRGAVKLFARGVATARLGDAFRSAVAGP